MRISDWSSDVCSSDLPRLFGRAEHRAEGIAELAAGQQGIAGGQVARELLAEGARQGEVAPFYVEIVGDLLPKRQEGLDRKSVVSGKSVSVRVDLGGRRIITKKKQTLKYNRNQQ